jgi:EpsI family protein
VILVAGAAFVMHTRGQSAMPLVAPLNTILDTIPGYRTKDQVISDDERRVAGMTNYVARAYSKDSAVAFTTLVSYYERQTQGKTIHSPRNCLPGAGWEVLTPGTKSVMAEGGPHVVNHFVLKNGPVTAITYYWYQGRGRVVANEYQVKWNLLRDAALAGHTEEALVRVVVYLPRNSSGEASVAEADSLGSAIAGQLIHEVRRVLPDDGVAAGRSRVSAANTAAAERIALATR